MKQIITAVVLLASALIVCAQDVIVTTDAKKIEAKITEVSKSEIKYKEFDNLDGPVFVLDVEEINSIIYENGKVVLYHVQHDAEEQVGTGNGQQAVSAVITKKDDVYFLGDRKMSEDEYLSFIQSNCEEAWKSYQKGCKLWKAGWGLFGAGVGIMTIGVTTMTYGAVKMWNAQQTRSTENTNVVPTRNTNYTEGRNIYVTGALVTGTGSCIAAGSIPCLIVGKIKRNNSHEVYNEVCASRHTAVTFGVQTSQNGIGIAMNF